MGEGRTIDQRNGEQRNNHTANIFADEYPPVLNQDGELGQGECHLIHRNASPHGLKVFTSVVGLSKH